VNDFKNDSIETSIRYTNFVVNVPFTYIFHAYFTYTRTIWDKSDSKERN